MIALQHSRGQITNQVRVLIAGSFWSVFQRSEDGSERAKGEIGNPGPVDCSVTILTKGNWKNVLGEIRRQRKARPSTFNSKYLAKLTFQEAEGKAKTIKQLTQ